MFVFFLFFLFVFLIDSYWNFGARSAIKKIQCIKTLSTERRKFTHTVVTLVSIDDWDFLFEGKGREGRRGKGKRILR